MKEILLHNDISFEVAHNLKAGDFQAVYESSRLRQIHFDGSEILRMIYPAVRAEDWSTIKGRIRNQVVSNTNDGFSISFVIEYDEADIKYEAEFRITAAGKTIEFEMNGRALSSFKSKRIGLCVHHPASFAGMDIDIKHDGGGSTRSSFPTLISSTWPFTDIRSMRWNVGNVSIVADFEGGVFETEDQRNWTDDSYKTYSGPQHTTPMLVINKGDSMHQKLTLTANYARYRFPKIGYGRGADQQPLTSEQLKLLKQIPFDHYRVEIDTASNGWADTLQQVIKEVKELNTRVELIINTETKLNTDGIEIVKQLNPISILIRSSIYPQLYDQLKSAFPESPVGFGTGKWFADLNASPLDELQYDFTAFRISPQAHQDDSRSILENLGSQYATIDTINGKTKNKPVQVSPIVFNTRKPDERVHTAFGAWWTVNAIHNFAASGHLSFYELTGPNGIVPVGEAYSPLVDLLVNIRKFNPLYIFKNKAGEIILENADDQLKIKFNSTDMVQL